MTVMKLLHATNTLSQAKDQPHRYKVRAGGLPTFGKATEPVVKTFSGASAHGALAAPVPREARKAAGSGWAKKLNPFAKQGAPVERTAVQGELSLEKVKPVRNDLCDANVERAGVKPMEARLQVMKIGSMEIPVVKAVPVWQRVRGMMQRLRP